MTPVTSFILFNDLCFWEGWKEWRTRASRTHAFSKRAALLSGFATCLNFSSSVSVLLLWISIFEKIKNRAGAQATDTKIPTKTKISLWQKCLLLGKCAASCFASPLTEGCCCLFSGLVFMHRFDLLVFLAQVTGGQTTECLIVLKTCPAISALRTIDLSVRRSTVRLFPRNVAFAGVFPQMDFFKLTHLELVWLRLNSGFCNLWRVRPWFFEGSFASKEAPTAASPVTKRGSLAFAAFSGYFKTVFWASLRYCWPTEDKISAVKYDV